MEASGQLRSDFLASRNVCVTGRLLSMTHDQLARLVSMHGGNFLRMPRRASAIVIVGEGGGPTSESDSTSGVFERARRLKAYGYSIEFLSEDDFLDQLGLSASADSIRGLHTIRDLCRILDISATRLRRWIRGGLIQPAESLCGIAYFNFRQVAFIKRINNLIEAGVPAADLRRGMSQWHELFPNVDLATVAPQIERDGRLVLRLDRGLVDSSGQRYFDFDVEDAQSIAAKSISDNVHDLCDQALLLEDEGQLAEAVDIYRQAIELDGSNGTLRFDLGNVLYRLDQIDAARAQFEASVAIDPDNAMAWHNLGSVHARLGAWEKAEESLRRSISLAPAYADSHFTLAEVYERWGKPEEAKPHQDAYRKFSKAEALMATRRNLLRVISPEDDSLSG